MTNAPRSFLGHAGLRAIACLSIIAYHLNQHRSTDHLAFWDWWWYRFMETLPVAVSLFFMLSAVSNSMGFWRSVFFNEPIPSVKKLFINRFFRIAPAYYTAILGTFAVVLLLQWGMQDVGIRLLAGFSFLSWIHPITFFPVDLNGPLWYISFDMMGAILVFATMYLVVRVRKFQIPLVLLAIAGLLIALHLWFVHLPFPRTQGVLWFWFPTYNPFIFGLHFLFGILAGAILVYQEKIQARPSLWYDGLFLLLAGFLIAFLFLVTLAPGRTEFAYSFLHTPYHFPLATALIALLIVSSPLTLLLGRWLDNRVFRFIAKLSYPLYLWHVLAIVLLSRFAIWEERHLSLFSLTELSVLTLILSCIVAWFSHRFIEWPISDWWKNRG